MRPYANRTFVPENRSKKQARREARIQIAEQAAINDDFTCASLSEDAFVVAIERRAILRALDAAWEGNRLLSYERSVSGS